MITVTGLTKRYGGRTVVDGVSFTLEPGTVTGFLGPNGAGKTTTMRMVTGLVPPTAGEALVDGHRYADLSNPAAVLGTLLDASAVHPGRTGRAHLRILADTVGVPVGRVDEVLDLVDLGSAAGRRRIGTYSLGMRQRLGIAGALLADPPVLMFDEPANGLDPEGIRWMRELLRGHAARGGTVLLSSHLLGEVEHTVDRLVVIGAGRVVADGPIGELLAGDGVLVRTLDPAALGAALHAAGFVVTAGADPVELRVAGVTAEQVGAVAARGGHVLTGLRPADRPLEELFFQLTAA
jgi:ABC-2 type transport system ATP-binding protein